MIRRENSFLQTVKQLDFVLILAVIALTIYGLVCVSTATAYHGTNRNVIVQLFGAVLILGGAILGELRRR